MDCAEFQQRPKSIEEYDKEAVAVDRTLWATSRLTAGDILCSTAFSGSSLPTRPRCWPSRSARPYNTSMARSNPCQSCCCRLRQPSRSWPYGTFTQTSLASGVPKSLSTGSCCVLAARLLTSARVAVEKFPGTAQCLSESTLFAACFLARVPRRLGLAPSMLSSSSVSC